MPTAAPPKSRHRTRGSSKPDPGCQGCGWKPAPGALWPTEGPTAVRWIQDNCICGEGDYYGQLIKLRPDQKAFLYRWYEHCPACGQWHYDEALRGAATGDGKTQFIASIVVLEFAGPSQIAVASPNIPIAAASFEQADLLFSAVATMCGGRDQADRASPLCGFFEVYDTEIKFSDNRPGRIFRVAAVAGTNEGGLPSLFVCDELHEWGEPVREGQTGARKARVKTVIGKSTKKRRTARGCGRVISLSTAGFDIDNSLLGDLVKLGRRVLHDPAVAPRFLCDWREAPEGLDYRRADHRELAVRAASAAADVLWSVADRVNAWGKPDYPPHEWIRYFANRWVDVAEDSWLKDHPAAWSDCRGEWEPDDANPWLLAVDMALKHDSVAVDRCERLPDGRVAVTTRIWRAGEHGGRIPHDDVWTYIRQRAGGLGFRGVVYDPRYFEVPARMLEEHSIRAVEFDQSPQRMVPAAGLVYKLILERLVVHDGDPELTAHVRAAVAVPQERGGFTLRKGRSKGHIDAAVAMCMGVWVLHEVPEPEQPFFAARR
jgi:phage terminase large subunit-like protein